LSTEHQFFDIEIPEGIDAATREVLADEIIDFIRERTQKGKSWRNTTLAGYSDAYAKSLEFKIAGKSRGDVNLTLSGDMLGALTLLDSEDGRLRIGFEDGSDENARADGNIRGTYGHDKPIGPKRDFLGITKRDLSQILESFTEIDALAGRLANRATGGGGEGDDG
jgi:hypothetical protein